MADRYAGLRAALETGYRDGGLLVSEWKKTSQPATIRALLADFDEAERALILAGKVNKDLMDMVLKLRKFIENEARKAERGGRVSLAKRCRAALAQEQP